MNFYLVYSHKTGFLDLLLICQAGQFFVAVTILCILTCPAAFLATATRCQSHPSPTVTINDTPHTVQYPWDAQSPPVENHRPKEWPVYITRVPDFESHSAFYYLDNLDMSLHLSEPVSSAGRHIS